MAASSCCSGHEIRPADIARTHRARPNDPAAGEPSRQPKVGSQDARPRPRLPAIGHARLDELRELRHDINYPADLVTPSAADLEAIRSLVGRVIAACAAKVNPPEKKITPPPPKRT
jgi:hypothetical protein